jgi:hypothetical protein
MNATDFYDEEQPAIRRGGLTLVTNNPAPELPAESAPDALTMFRTAVAMATRDALAGIDTRPVVHVHNHAAPATAPAGGHPGITVPIPFPTAEPARRIPRARRLFTRAELVAYCGISVAATSGIGGIAASITGSFIPLGVAGVGGMLASFGAAIACNRDDDRRIAGEQR